MTELTPPRCAKHDRALTVCAECYTPPRDTADDWRKYRVPEADKIALRRDPTPRDTTDTEALSEWNEDGDGHGYRYQYIGPIHYLCECGDPFLNRDGWLIHKGAAALLAAGYSLPDPVRDTALRAEALREAADDIDGGDIPLIVDDERMVRDWLRERADRIDCTCQVVHGEGRTTTKGDCRVHRDRIAGGSL